MSQDTWPDNLQAKKTKNSLYKIAASPSMEEADAEEPEESIQ